MARYHTRFKNPDGSDKEVALTPKKVEIVEPRCAVCKSPHRRYIDSLLVLGTPYSEIARLLEEEGLSRRSISNHRNRHLSIETAAIRQILEDKARQMDEDVENGKRAILTRKGILEVTLLRGYNGVVNQEVPVEARDMVNIVAQLEKMDESSSTVQIEELNRQMNCFLDAVKLVVPQDQWNQIMDQFDRNLNLSADPLSSYSVEVPEELAVGVPADLKRAMKELEYLDPGEDD